MAVSKNSARIPLFILIPVSFSSSHDLAQEEEDATRSLMSNSSFRSLASTSLASADRWVSCCVSHQAVAPSIRLPPKVPMRLGSAIDDDMAEEEGISHDVILGLQSRDRTAETRKCDKESSSPRSETGS
jgi:hypothetical protein